MILAGSSTAKLGLEGYVGICSNDKGAAVSEDCTQGVGGCE